MRSLAIFLFLSNLKKKVRESHYQRLDDARVRGRGAALSTFFKKRTGQFPVSRRASTPLVYASIIFVHLRVWNIVLFLALQI